MSAHSPRELEARRRVRRHATRNRVVLAAAILLAFGIGIALGQALNDNPRPGGEQTVVKTLPPLTATISP
jgi:hypothetical protein